MLNESYEEVCDDFHEKFTIQITLSENGAFQSIITFGFGKNNRVKTSLFSEGN